MLPSRLHIVALLVCLSVVTHQALAACTGDTDCEVRGHRPTVQVWTYVIPRDLTHTSCVGGGAVAVNRTQLNGKCVAGACHCFPGWTGTTCGTLKLRRAPAMTVAGHSSYALYPMQRPLPPHHEGHASNGAGMRRSGTAPAPPLGPEPDTSITWGGTVIEDGGLHHLFVDVCCYSPSTIMHDVNGCQTIHATSTNPLNETFRFADVALPPQHDCPHITKGSDGTYLLYNTGQSMDCATTCTGEPAPNRTNTKAVSQDDRPCSGTGFFGLNLATSKSLSGPWTLHDNIPIEGYGQPISSQTNVNPSPLLLDNGTVIIAYTDSANGEQIALAKADNPVVGPYSKLGAPSIPIFDHHCEDPFIYKGRLGYHIICHDMERGGSEGNGCRYQGYDPVLGPSGNENCTGQVGLHAFAEKLHGDGSGWATAARLKGNASEPSAYSHRVEFDDGSSFAFFRRERPELRTNAEGDPTHLITGIEYFADHPGKATNHQYSFTIVQEVDRDGGYIGIEESHLA